MAEICHGPADNSHERCHCGEEWPYAGWVEQQADLDDFGRTMTYIVYREKAPAHVAERVRVALKLAPRPCW